MVTEQEQLDRSWLSVNQDLIAQIRSSGSFRPEFEGGVESPNAHSSERVLAVSEYSMSGSWIPTGQEWEH